jgi:hypothetical protein
MTGFAPRRLRAIPVGWADVTGQHALSPETWPKFPSHEKDRQNRPDPTLLELNPVADHAKRVRYARRAGIAARRRAPPHCQRKNRAAIPKQTTSQAIRTPKQTHNGENGVPSTMTWRSASPR